MDFEENEIKETKEQNIDSKTSFWKEFGIVALALGLAILTVIVINI